MNFEIVYLSIKCRNTTWPLASPEEFPHSLREPGNKKAFDADTLVGEGSEFQERVRADAA